MSKPKEVDQLSDSGLMEIVIPVKLAHHLTTGELNVYNFCRICMNEFSECISIFDSKIPLLYDMFSLFTSIQISRDDGFPPNLCISCKEQLICCLDFKQQCEKADIIWKTSLKGAFINNIEQKTGHACLHDNMELNEREMKEEKLSQLTQKIKEESEGEKPEETYEIRFTDGANYDIIDDDNESQYLENAEVTEAVRVNNEDTYEVKFSQYSKYENCDTFEDQNEPQYLENLECMKEERLEEEISQVDCNICSQPFTDPSELKLHHKSHLQEVYSCEYCSKTFIKAWSLKRHIQMSHMIGNKLGIIFPCKYCKEKFSSAGDLRIHSSVHNECGNKCIQCFKEFTSKQQLKRHLLRHMDEKKYKCDSCSKCFSELYAMHRHQRVHTGEALEKKHACNVCNKRFVYMFDLKAHSRRHVGELPYVCAQCGKAFMSARLLRSHTLIHNENKPYKCDHCDKRFRHDSTRKTHHRTHTGEKPYICSICGKRFIQNSNLRLHLRTHSGEKPYKCKICERPFSASSTLKAHQRTHSGEKPHECTICGKRFARMYEHMRLHSGEKPYPCGICDKHFYTASRLREHNRVHTGEKPFECNCCSQKFTSKSHLVKHIKMHEIKSIEKTHRKNVIAYTNDISTKLELGKDASKEVDIHDLGDKFNAHMQDNVAMEIVTDIEGKEQMEIREQIANAEVILVFQ